MSFQDCLNSALTIVLDWDIPDEIIAGDTFGEMIRSQACIMARSYLD